IQRTCGTTTDVLVCSCVVVVGSHTNKVKSAESNSLTRTCHWQKRGAHLQQMSRHRRWQQHLNSLLHELLQHSTWRLDIATNRHRRIAHHRCFCKHATHHASFVKKSQINQVNQTSRTHPFDRFLKQKHNSRHIHCTHPNRTQQPFV
ncbi:unnamed protein product, partial [Ectocarpus sp. 12 AP-2014]